MQRTLIGLTKLLRYRFLLIAGLFPYALGAAVAFYTQGQFSLFLFLIGITGLFFALMGVEAFNEFFDWRMGTDRVFQLNPQPVPNSTFLVGMAAFFVALVVAIFLTLELGLPIIVLSLMGLFIALFYMAPPIKLAYRGFGEIMISLSYGPLMMMGSYYVQVQRIDLLPFFVSVIPALLLFAISIMNEVPDYFQDRLAGKRNICVRIGQKNVVRLYGAVLALFYVVLLVGLLSGRFPWVAWVLLACLPISLLSYTTGVKTYDNPYRFVSAIRYMIMQYIIILGVLITGYIV
ncbi:MAG: prenyltransferase [Firmicutes bacterium]|nr:prenyltransferase [Bacillota bacterium]